MNGLTRLILDHPGATTFGAMGLACQMAWPLFQSRRVILAIQLGVGLLYCAQYALLGAHSAAAVCAVGATQTMLALGAGDRRWLRQAGYVFLPVVAILCIATWSGLPSALALCAVSLTMLGRLQGDVFRLRLFQLGAVPFGFGHDLLVGAAPALIGCVLSACIAAAALLRDLRQRRAAALPATLCCGQI